MGTVPTGKLERELRALYLRWLTRVPAHEDDLQSYIEVFRQQSTALIRRLGGQTASLGALAGFPVPKTLELSPYAGAVYDQMQLAAVQAGIGAGLQATDVARQMLNAGLDKSFRRLNRLARTETVSAYWKNQWDSVADLPLIVMVWGSENSKRTCDYCRSRDGLVVEDPNIRDHPNGRCTLIPTLRSRVDYKGTLQADGSVTMDEAWTGKKTKSIGVAGEATREQLDPISGKSNPAAPSSSLTTQRGSGVATATESAWKPVMTRAEADRWAADSKLTQPFYHGSSVDGAAAIRVGGFDPNRTAVGQYGSGTYLTPSKDYADMYAKQAGGDVIEARVNVQNPADYWAETRGQDFGDFVMGRMDAGMSTPDAMTEYFKSRGFDSVLVKNGDTINELLVFEVDKVVVVS